VVLPVEGQATAAVTPSSGVPPLVLPALGRVLPGTTSLLASGPGWTATEAPLRTFRALRAAAEAVPLRPLLSSP
jgi:hypothetical protein